MPQVYRDDRSLSIDTRLAAKQIRTSWKKAEFSPSSIDGTRPTIRLTRSLGQEVVPMAMHALMNLIATTEVMFTV